MHIESVKLARIAALNYIKLVPNIIHMATLHELYTLAVEIGMKHDPRSSTQIQRLLKELKEKYDKLSKKEKEFFDTDALENPYSDSRILNGDQKTKIKTLACGIDIDVGELLLVDRIQRDKGKIDAVMSHHPQGRAFLRLYKLMDMQIDVLKYYGVPENITEKLMTTRAQEVMRLVSPSNAQRAVRAAELLGIPFFNIHTPADNSGYQFIQNLINKNVKNLYKLQDIYDLIMTIPEFIQSAKMGSKPKYMLGNKKSRVGKIAVTEFTGGTSGPKELYEKLAMSGIGTIISMHINDINRKEAEKYHLNVIAPGHMACDSLGVNLILDQFEKKGVKIIPLSGLIRISRNK